MTRIEPRSGVRGSLARRRIWSSGTTYRSSMSRMWWMARAPDPDVLDGEDAGHRADDGLDGEALQRAPKVKVSGAK